MATESRQAEQIQGPSLLEQVEQLQQFGGGPQEFLRQLLALQCQIAFAEAGAILRLSQDGQLEVLAVHPPPEANAPDPLWLAQSAQSMARVLETSETQVVPLHADDALYGQDPHQQLVLIPVRASGNVRGVASFLMNSYDRTRLAHARERLELSISLLGLYEMRQTLEHRNHSLRWLREAMEVLARMNEQGKFRAVAMALCNELAARQDARRVSLGTLRGRYVKVQAISHTENFTRKMQVVQDLEAAMEECLDQDVEILNPTPPDADYVYRATDRLVSRHGPSAVCSLPLRHEGEPFAVLTVECDPDQAPSLDEIECLRLVCDLCAARIWERHEHDRWIGVRAVKRMRIGLGGMVGPRHTWAKVAALAAMILLFFLLFVEGDDNVKADFEVQSVKQQVIPAPFDGDLKAVHVERGDPVVAGKTILATFDTIELTISIVETMAEKDRYETEAKIAWQEKEPDEARIAQLNAEKLSAEIERLNHYISKAQITSSISGIVMSGDLKKLVQAPFTKGDPLLEVAEEGLRAELLVPEDRIGDLEVGQEGRLATASDPGDHMKFQVVHISPAAEVVDADNVFRVRVDLKETPEWLKPGMSGGAKIQVGRAVWGKILTRDIANWIQMRLWMLW